MYFVTASLPAFLMPSVLLAGLYLPLGSVQPPRIDHQHGLKTRYIEQPAQYNSSLPVQVFFFLQKSAKELSIKLTL
jgi:hypothetical protein